MTFWKKKVRDHTSSPREIHTSPPSPARPRHVLVWIDASYADHPARIIRGLALAEAFKQASILQVTLACLPTRHLPAETEKRNLHWLNTRPGGAPLLFHEILKTTQADLVIADCLTPPRFQPAPPLVLFALVSDLFSDSLLASPMVDSLLIPGLACPPDFSSLSLLPSRLADCFHGPRYIPLLAIPDEAGNTNPAPASTEDKTVLIAISGNENPEILHGLLERIRESWKGRIQILADIPPSAGERLKEALGGENTVLHDPPLPDRWKAIGAAQTIVAFPGLQVYEFLGCGKPVILLPRSDPEERIGRLLEARGAVRVIPVGASINMEKLKESFNELNQNETLRSFLQQKAKEIVEDGGARNAVDLWLRRYRRRVENGKNT
ncbi:MAG: hypothetical protein ACE15F_14515 [bacterium]